uniref:CSD domain-containing protein n=1 Tax=Alexandrium monilatum TaxID=311494 RepID=A0A7S4PRQ6_9DINO
MAPRPYITGTMRKESGGRFGFITQDDGNGDMFVMPAECVGFGRRLPPVGTRVMFTIGRDPMKGQPRAEDVVPEDEGEGMMQQDHVQNPDVTSIPRGGKLTGTVKRNNGRFGFILQDNGDADMFLMPVQCQAFGGEIPPLGTRVVFSVAMDQKTGKPRAEDVEPEEAYFGPGPTWHEPPRQTPRRTPRREPSRELSRDPQWQSPWPPAQEPSIPLPEDSIEAMLEAGTCTGVVKQNSGRFGFILPDGSDKDMFFMPIQCQAFGGVCPPVGTRVMYEVAEDQKTKKPRAENVRPEDPDAAEVGDAGRSRSQPASAPGPRGPSGSRSGAVKLNNGNFGFLLQDSGEPDLFVMPAQCPDFGGMVPPLGTRVTFDAGIDPKTGKWRAESVRPEEETSSRAGPSSFGSSKGKGSGGYVGGKGKGKGEGFGGVLSGVIKQNNGRFGFIVPDDGQADVFVMPMQCVGFGGECPPVGTRVVYKVGPDAKTGKLRAEDVWPESPWGMGPGCYDDYDGGWGYGGWKGGWKGGYGGCSSYGLALRPGRPNGWGPHPYSRYPMGY